MDMTGMSPVWLASSNARSAMTLQLTEVLPRFARARARS